MSMVPLEDMKTLTHTNTRVNNNNNNKHFLALHIIGS